MAADDFGLKTLPHQTWCQIVQTVWTQCRSVKLTLPDPVTLKRELCERHFAPKSTSLHINCVKYKNYKVKPICLLEDRRCDMLQMK